MSQIIENLSSTIIPVYNRPALLGMAVRSVLAQTYRPIEIIISDDGSTDDTPQVAESFCNTYPEIIRLVKNPNRGPGPAREAGRRLARGEFIQYLDSDDRLMPGKFECQVNALRNHPECDAAYGRTRLATMDEMVIADPFKWTGKSFQTLFPALLIDRWWCTHTPLYRRSVCEAIGSWSDLRYSQDWEYDGRVGALGTQLIWCDELVSEHRIHENMRQTGHGKWLIPMERARFFSLMFQHARKAGVGLDAPEMKHFSRWVFYHARQCGAMGDVKAARICFDVAVQAAGSLEGDLKIYRMLAVMMGWKAVGKIFGLLDEKVRRRPGPDTRKQSWMEG